MFGRGAEPKLEPMTAYPKKDLKELASVVNQNKIISIENVDITALPAISIDRIKMKPCMNGFNRGIMFETEHSVDSKYIQAWQKGLGKFIQRDYRKESNTEKYVLIKYIHALKKNDTVYPLNYYAFCRIITKDEVDGDGIVEDMKDYNAISFELTTDMAKLGYDKDIKDPVYVSVLKLYPDSTDYDAVTAIGIRVPIKNNSDNDLKLSWNDDSNVFAAAINNTVEEEPDAVNTLEEELF